MSLVLTRIQNIRANSNLDKFEYRPSRYGALNAFMVQSEDPTGILTEELKQKARTSIGNTLETPVIDYDADITIGNTRTLTIADSENTSKMVQITFAGSRRVKDYSCNVHEQRNRHPEGLRNQDDEVHLQVCSEA